VALSLDVLKEHIIVFLTGLVGKVIKPKKAHAVQAMKLQKVSMGFPDLV
jgi:hypothetical protein